ncbi:hypothetical protein D3C80_1637650 [compost metagenome]
MVAAVVDRNVKPGKPVSVEPEDVRRSTVSCGSLNTVMRYRRPTWPMQVAIVPSVRAVTGDPPTKLSVISGGVGPADGV